MAQALGAVGGMRQRAAGSARLLWAALVQGKLNGAEPSRGSLMGVASKCFPGGGHKGGIPGLWSGTEAWAGRTPAAVVAVVSWEQGEVMGSWG